MSNITVKAGDFGYNLSFTVLNADGTAFNLTGYTIAVKAWAAGTPSVLVATGTGTIVVAASGTCTYLVQATDFLTAGEYLLELELTATGVEVSTLSATVSALESG